MSQALSGPPPPTPLTSNNNTNTVSPVTNNEQIVFSIYCVVYQLQDSSWVVLGNGWSQLHLCRHTIHQTYRMVAMSVQSQKNVMNVNLTHACKYQRKSPDFHKLTCSNTDVWGFGFYSSPSSLEQAVAFLSLVEDVHQDISKSVVRRLSSNTTGQTQTVSSPSRTRGVSYAQAAGTSRPSVVALASNYGGTTSSPRSAAPAVPSRPSISVNQKATVSSPAQPASHQVVAPKVPMPSGMSSSKTTPNSTLRNGAVPPPPSVDTYTGSRVDTSNIIPTAHVRQLGDLKVLPPKLLATVSSDAAITTPISVRHTAHVAYNHKKGIFEGLPQDWEKHLDQVYGQSLESLEMVQTPLYEGRIPKILFELARRLFEQDAVNSVGVFRLAPHQSESETARKKIDDGELIGSAAAGVTQFNYDVNVIASLIKIWLRDLPVKLWDSVNKARVETCVSEYEAWQIVQSIAPAIRPTCEFLIDICVTICKNEEVNKMTSQNLSICISPNLFTENRDQPMNTLIFSQKIAKVFGLAIDYRRYSFPDIDVVKMFS